MVWVTDDDVTLGRCRRRAARATSQARRPRSSDGGPASTELAATDGRPRVAGGVRGWSAGAQAQPAVLFPPPDLPPGLGLPFAFDLLQDLRPRGSHYQVRRVQDAGHLAFGDLRLLFDLRADQRADDEAAVDDVLFVARALCRAAPGRFRREVEHAKPGHLASRIGPALKVPAVFPHRHWSSLARLWRCLGTAGPRRRGFARGWPDGQKTLACASRSTSVPPFAGTVTAASLAVRPRVVAIWAHRGPLS